MKKVALVLALLMSAVSVTPAVALEEVGLGPTGLLEAKKAGFDGSGFEFGVLSRHFSNKFPSLDGKFASEACFAGTEDWATKCSNGESTHYGQGAAVTEDSYATANPLVYGLIGSPEMIAPKAKAHAIRTLDNQQRLPDIIDYALEKGLDALFYNDTWAYPTRGMELNCDAAYPEIAVAVAKATDLGLAIFADSTGGGNTYGLSFPNCITGVIPISYLDYESKLDQSTNFGPGLVAAHSRFSTLSNWLNDGKESFDEHIDNSKALAVVGGIFAALLSEGYSPKVSLEAVRNSTQTVDGLFFKGIPVANYLRAKDWAKAQELADPDLVLSKPVQVSSRAISLTLLGNPAPDSRVLGYEIFDSSSGTWDRILSDANSSLAMVIEPIVSSGWVRLVVSRSGVEKVSTAAAFSIGSDFVLETKLTAVAEKSKATEVAAEAEFATVAPSSRSWPRITDPAALHLELDYARDMQVTGKGVTVAIIDDGYQLDHPYIDASRVVEGYCQSAKNSCPNGRATQYGVAAVESPIPEGEDSRDDHGTMVAGTIGGYPTSQANGGIAPEVTFIVARIDFSIEETSGFIENALEWIYSLKDRYNIAAVNMSFGSGADWDRTVYQEGVSCDGSARETGLISKLHDAGIAPVIASGNDGMLMSISEPSCLNGAISVGATDNDGEVIAYSNISEDVDILAPARMKTSLTDRSYDEGSGTSNATPVVVGAFALAQQIRPELSVEEVLFAMRASADRIDDVLVKDLPRLNIRKFLDYLTSETGLAAKKPQLRVTELGISCAVEFDPQESSSYSLRYRESGSSTWSIAVGVASPFLLGGLSKNTNYELELGATESDTTFWSKRGLCNTNAGSIPGAISSAVVEARGPNWAVVRVDRVEANGNPLLYLNYKTGSTAADQAVPIGSNRYYLPNVGTAPSVSLSFQNDLGEGGSFEAQLPSYVSPRVPQAFSKTTTLTGFKTSALLAAHKSKLAKDLGPLEGVATITCTGYFATNATAAAKNVVKKRATNSCAESRKLHPMVTTVVKTTSTKTKAAVGTVKVIASGSN